jgi:WD40 repeat protein
MITKLITAVSQVTNPFSDVLGWHEGTVRKVVLSADGRYAGTASGDHTAKIWDLQSQKCITTLGSKPQNLTGGGIGNGHRHIVTCK